MNAIPPKVSIIVPCYNQAQFLDEALQSVLDQTYTNWECIIVNDGSPDHTEAVAQKWVDKDARFVYLKKENGGLSSARNVGLDKSNGDFIQFLDSDDCLDKRKLELSLQELDSAISKDVKVAITNFRRFVDELGLSIEPYCNLNLVRFNLENILYQWEDVFTIPIHCGLFEATFFKKFRFPEHIKAKEDWVMWVSLFKSNCKVIFIDKPLAFYRRNPESMTMKKDMFPDFIKAYEYFELILSAEQFQAFTIQLLTKYYKSDKEFKSRLDKTKKSNTYQTGLLIKKVLKTLGILKWCTALFPLFLKFKKQ